MTDVATVTERGTRPKRAKIFHPATLSLNGAAARIHLLDVSETGALAHGTPPPRLASVEVSCAGLHRTARVRWCEGKRFGLQFDRPLLPSQLEALAPTLSSLAGKREPCPV